MNEAERIERWNFLHAIVLLGAGAASLAVDRSLGVVLAAAGSFGALTIAFRGRWTPAGGFGVANTVTAIRLAVCLAAAVAADHVIPHPVFVLIWLAVFGLDGLDGFFARRRGETSLFGEYFDKESDALFVLLLGFSLHVQHLLGAWVLVAGALRYLFVLAMHFMPAGGPRKEYRSRWARYIYTTCILSFIAVYLLPSGLATGLAQAGTAALVYSFLRYFHWLFSGGAIQGESMR